MRVAFCSSEIFPFAKTGGLADVSAALPSALARIGCQVRVFMPFYKGIEPAEVFEEYGYLKNGRLEFYFIKNDKYFKRQGLYGDARGDYPDNLERFSFFCKKILNLLQRSNFSPEIIHCNDWQTALIPVYLNTTYSNLEIFKNTKTVLTIHNLSYQGIFPKSQFRLLDIGWEHFSVDKLEFFGQINLLKGGVACADRITTVSPTYAKQIQTPDYGCGLEGVLRKKRRQLCGILNAVDYSLWNPRKDDFLYSKYSLHRLENKYINKRKLQKELGFKVSKNTLLIGVVSRLVEQKGVDILCDSLNYLLNKYQLIVLGRGQNRYHRSLRRRANKPKKAFCFSSKFDESFAHRIYAASDIFLMPSLFEPCGLSQLISYKYGTVPVVHSTGGLIDTVEDYSQGGGGFVFEAPASGDLIVAIERAARLFRDKQAWYRLMRKIMKYDFSWYRAASRYIDMYRVSLVKDSRETKSRR